ncbi:MAG: hypothetical protein JSW33_02060, partial [bacterium]
MPQYYESHRPLVDLQSVVHMQDEEAFFPFEDNYTHDGLFVHEFISYAFHPYWQLHWEQHQYSDNALRMSVGSIRTDELLVHGELNLNEDLSRGWWFNTRGIWYSNLHRNHRDLSIYMGLERALYKGISFFALCFPRFNKEYLGVQLGLSWFGKQREHYFNLALVLPEMVYDEKNELGGKSNRKPLGIQWYTRYQLGKFIAYSEGLLGNSFERIFPDPEKSPLQTSHDRKINQAQFKLYYESSPVSMLQLHLYTYLFKETKTYYAVENNFDYRNLVSDISLRYLLRVREKHRFQLLTQYVLKDARSLGYREHEFDRTDFLGGLFYEYTWSDHTIEVGYMLSLYDWSYNSGNDALDEELQNKYYDKVYIGYAFAFTENAFFRISVSHQP